MCVVPGCILAQDTKNCQIRLLILLTISLRLINIGGGERAMHVMTCVQKPKNGLQIHSDFPI